MYGFTSLGIIPFSRFDVLFTFLKLICRLFGGVSSVSRNKALHNPQHRFMEYICNIEIICCLSLDMFVCPLCQKKGLEKRLKEL